VKPVFFLGVVEMGGIEPPSRSANHARLQVYWCEVFVGRR